MDVSIKYLYNSNQTYYRKLWFCIVILTKLVIESWVLYETCHKFSPNIMLKSVLASSFGVLVVLYVLMQLYEVLGAYF